MLHRYGSPFEPVRISVSEKKKSWELTNVQRVLYLTTEKLLGKLLEKYQAIY